MLGVDGWRRNFGGFLTAFPDYAETLEDIIVEGDAAATRVTFRATHRGDLMGLPPTGRRIEAAGMAFLHVRDGRLAEQWIAADMLGMMQQIGAVPGTGSAAT